jgi:hypothetical protein
MDENNIFDHGNTTSPIPPRWSTKIWNPFQWFMDSLNYIEVLTTIDNNQVLSKTLSKALE